MSKNKAAKVGIFVFMSRERVEFRDLGLMNYKEAWDYQETLLQENVRLKAAANASTMSTADVPLLKPSLPTTNYLLFVEHPPVYTLGKSGNLENVLINEEERREQGI